MKMSTQPIASTISHGMSFETDLAVLEVQNEQSNYQSDSAILESARAAKRAHDRAQVDALRSKASTLLASGITQGVLLTGSGAVQGLGVASQYDADMDRAHVVEGAGVDKAPTLTAAGAAAQRNANLYVAAAKGADGIAKGTDIVLNAVTANEDANATDASHEAENAKWRADDASSARQRDQSRLDQSLSVVEEMLRSDHETMRNLLRPA
jgi:hypothetical protein